MGEARLRENWRGKVFVLERRWRFMSEGIDELLIPSEFPRWREAIKLFLAEQHKPGDIISHDWLYDAFGIARPHAQTPMGEADKARLAFLAAFKPFQERLLDEYNIDLANVPGVGYKVMPPAEQTEAAYEDGMGDIRKGLRRMARRITFVDSAALSSGQKRENADALAKLAMMNGMLRQVKRINASVMDDDGIGDVNQG